MKQQQDFDHHLREDDHETNHQLLEAAWCGNATLDHVVHKPPEPRSKRAHYHKLARAPVSSSSPKM
eukprot:1640672-Amphidinium_carterae.1